MMEKNKNRADLLAVGRKKLQQFRQKKDGKGNSSRSSVKGSKSGHETTSKNDNPDEVSQRAGIPEILPLAVSARLPLESSGVNQTSLNQNAYDSEATQKDEPFYSVHDVISKEAGSCDPIIIVERAEDPHISLPPQILSETVRQHGEEQETDVGTMEIEIDKGVVKLHEGHGNVSSNDLNEVTGDNKTSDSGDIPSVDAPVAGSSTIDVEEAYEAHGHSIDASPMTDSGTVSTTSSVVVDKMSEDIIGSSNEEVAVILRELNASNASSHAPGTQTERLPELIGATENSLGCKQLDFSSVLDGSVVKLSQLSWILRNLDEDDFRFLFMSGELLLDKVRGADKIKFQEFVGCNEFERFKEQLYETCFLKDVFHLQLFEQQMLISEISAANASQGEVLSKNDMFAEEISHSRHELQEAVSEREKLQEQLHSSKAEVERFSAEVDELQKQLEGARDGISALSSELVDCKILIEALQAENKNLNGSLLVMAEEKKKFLEESMESKDLVVTLQMEISDMNRKLMSLKGERMRLEEEKESIYSEYEKQYLELVGIKISGAVLEAECDKLKEVASRVDQLIEENGTISADLELHKLKLKDLERKDYSSQSDETADQGIQNDIRALQKPKSIWLSEELNLGAYGDSNGFIALKRKLDDAEIAMQKLEKEIDTSNSHLISLNRSSDKVVAPGVSKLIHAFESKHQADDNDPERSTSSENQTSGDPYRGIKLIIENLRMLLKDLTGDAENAVESCTVTWSRLLATARADRSEYNSLREHTDRVEQEYIVFMVLHEAMKEHISHAVTKEVELLSLCDVLQKQKMDLKSENGHILEKLNDSQVKIGELQSQLDRICRDIDDMVSYISTEVQILQEEVRPGGESFLEEQWNSVCVRVLQTVGVVDSTIKILSGNSQAGIDNNTDISSLVGTFIDGATRVIDFLHKQLDDAHRLRQETLDRNYMALHTLHTLHSELNGLVGGAIPENSVVADKVMDLLNLDAFNTLMDQLKQSSVERMQIESENKLLSSELANRAREANEMDKKWIKSLVKLVEEIEKSVRLEGIVIDTEEPSSRLESLIHLLIQKCNEAEQTLSLSTSLEMQLAKLQKEMDHLHVVLVQYENENFVLKQNLKSAEESVIALGRKAQEKTAELEMSEQKALSLREKLSIAVTKGKGLISQRESLKQSLAETSKELEKSSQELLFKDARLYELETKLKAYSEAGERMEALESELSYIRNSATALRESFLLKDSVLQRIEEVLEDLELPEQFHSGNIIEKIEWLAKSFGGNPSSPLGDMDHRSSVQGVSYTDAGIIGADVSKEDMQTNPDSIADLRIRYEELQTKFYGLAEQNEMLEQSLLQRNHLVKMWEETLGMVNLPSQVQSMEPEYKIQWMGSAFSEAQNHCYSLEKRIDDLEALCRSLTAYLEDSQGRTSELVSAFQQLFVEKEVLSMISEILSHDNDDMLKKTIDLKTRNENLQNEVIVLQEQKLQLEEDVCHSEAAIRMLQESVNSALQYSITEDVGQNQKGVEYLEETLKELVEKYKSLSSDVNVNELTQTSRNFEGQDMVTLKKELEDSMGELTCMRKERNKYMEDNHLLLYKIEELERKEKELQDLLNQEEQKSATLREKLNVAVRKGKSLVQKRDGLNQTIEELNVEVERLKSEVKCSVKAISEYEEQIKNLLTAQERVQVLESENASLCVHLAESKHYLQEKEDTWGSILVGLNEIDVGIAFDSGNPIEKLDGISKCLNDLRTKLGIHEVESRKSKKAAELLLTELNEVQERYDGLQEELAKAVHELSEVRRERDAAENAKNESLAQISHLEGGQREMQSTIINLQKELQEKDITREKICLELVTQIKESETKAKTYLHDLQQANAHLHDSQKQLDNLKKEREVWKQRLEELQHHETNSLELEKQVNSLTSALAAKAQETETLMQALEEQETEMEDLTEKVGEMEKDLLQKNQDLENLDASRAKALKKLSVTVSKFDELHYLSESLLAEVEKLQTQLQERDGEISFLRKEVTRCTNDALAVTQLSKQRSSGEVLDLLSRLDALLSKVQGHDAVPDDLNSLPVEECKDVLEKKIMALISELENIHVVAQNNSMLLHEERCKVNELAQKEQYLKNSLREKESEIVMLQGEMESAKATKSNSDIMEAEQMNNKWASPTNVVPQVRSLRKSNNDQVAIAIDMDRNSDRLDDDDDDDKAHGFKSLTTSKIVPRFTRPVSDLVDGLWVSCDRALMRQPALRLGVIFYWALLHAMLATFVV